MCTPLELRDKREGGGGDGVGRRPNREMYRPQGAQNVRATLGGCGTISMVASAPWLPACGREGGTQYEFQKGRTAADDTIGVAARDSHHFSGGHVAPPHYVDPNWPAYNVQGGHVPFRAPTTMSRSRVKGSAASIAQLCAEAASHRDRCGKLGGDLFMGWYKHRQISRIHLAPPMPHGCRSRTK